MNKKNIILEIREILNMYQDTMTKDVEQSLRNLIDYIEGVKDEWKRNRYRQWNRKKIWKI